MNIVWVRFGVRPGVLGGGAVRKREFTRRLRGRVDVYLVTHEASYEWYRSIGVEAKPLSLVRARWAWRQNFASVLYSMLRALLSRFRGEYHIVAARSHYLHDLIPALWIKFSTRAKLAVYIQSRVLPNIKRRSFLNLLIVIIDHMISIALIKRSADLVFVLNNYDKALLESLGVDPRKICLIYHGLDLEKINAIAEPKMKVYDAVYFGRFSRTKGVYDLLDAWANVIKAVPNAKLLIFGPGTEEDRRRILEHANKLSLNKHLTLRGFLPEEDKYELVKKSKIYINPSYVDTWGIAIAEAIACKIPVIAYDLPTYKTAYENAITMVKHGDKTDLAIKILQLLSNEELRRKKAEKAYVRIIGYTWQKAIKKELEALTNLSGAQMLQAINNDTRKK
jgi:glycosyltransferase involved in cell wall biosynthesis